MPPAPGEHEFVDVMAGASRWEIPVLDHGFRYQAAEFARALAAGRTQTWSMPWDATRRVMATMDETRRQVGVVYPASDASPGRQRTRSPGRQRTTTVLPMGMRFLSQIMLIAALLNRAHPWEAGHGGMFGEPCTAMPR